MIEDLSFELTIGEFIEKLLKLKQKYGWNTIVKYALIDNLTKTMEPKTYEVAYNACYGGFSLSKEAVLFARKEFPNSKTWFPPNCVLIGEKYSDGTINDSSYSSLDKGMIHLDVSRHDKELIHIIKTLGSKKASGKCAKLEIETIDTPLYKIDEYDGNETVITNKMDPGWINAE